MVPNSVLRVMSDSNAGLAYLTLLYIDWLAKQLMPDTAETEWLDRFGDIWRPGGTARKAATFATGILNMQATVAGTVLPSGTIFTATVTGNASLPVQFQSTAPVTLALTDTPVPVVALTAGPTQLQANNQASLQNTVTNVVSSGTFASLVDGIAEEDDDQLRIRVLDRIRQPPMGGDAEDYVQWAMAVPGVTRAWCSPNEMGIGTITLRFMMDDLRATDDPLTNGVPTPTDVDTVYDAVNARRPVAVKDFFCVAPIPYPINFTVANLQDDTPAIRAAIDASINTMLRSRAAPAAALNGVAVKPQEIYAVWLTEAILAVDGVEYFDNLAPDFIMPTNGSLAVLGSITYVTTSTSQQAPGA
jgi:uncharacterized phage protein gp47/JayE